MSEANSTFDTLDPAANNHRPKRETVIRARRASVCTRKGTASATSRPRRVFWKWKWKWIEMSRNGGIASPPLPSRSWPFESPARLVDISPSVASREVTSLTTSNLQSSAILWSLLFGKKSFHLHPLQREKHEDIHAETRAPSVSLPCHFAALGIGVPWQAAPKLGRTHTPQVHPTKLALASPVALRSSFFPSRVGVGVGAW